LVVAVCSNRRPIAVLDPGCGQFVIGLGMLSAAHTVYFVSDFHNDGVNTAYMINS
jgi:hypothetical protein